MQRILRGGSRLTVLAGVVFLLWAAAFIARTSSVARDGRRYFCLFDDAMISMRYADNLAHRHGLVWNPGERVEGYTNLLMTLVMAVPNALLEKRFAVLSMQVLGVFIALGFAWATRRLAGELDGARPDPARGASRAFAFALGLAYYPTVYWSLMGMETGLVTLLLLVCLVCTLRSTAGAGAGTLAWLATAGGLAAITRADTVVVTLPLLLVAAGAAWRQRRASLRLVSGLLLLYLCLPAAQLVFRVAYYGALVPLTYTLKLGGFPLGFRIRNGLGYLAAFFGQTWPLFLTAAVGALAEKRRRRLLALAVPAVLVAYQISIGGDFSNYWRFLSPAAPILLVLAWLGLTSTAAAIAARSKLSPHAVAAAGFVATAALVVWVNRPFLPEILFRSLPFCADDCPENVDIALTIRELTHRSASVGVFQAGTIPYYSERPALDFLGKSDPYIASLPPDLSGAVAWHGMKSVPGHNKYDLRYSIKSRTPVYIEDCRWGRQNVCRWTATHYREVVFRGRLLYLLRDSPYVDWAKATR